MNWGVQDGQVLQAKKCLGTAEHCRLFSLFPLALEIVQGERIVLLFSSKTAVFYLIENCGFVKSFEWGRYRTMFEGYLEMAHIPQNRLCKLL